MALEERAKEADNGKEATEDTPSAATKVRTNFNETAFFFPDLKTDKDGNVNFIHYAGSPYQMEVSGFNTY